MKTVFFAEAASFSDDGDATVLAFADSPSDPANYVILDFANEPDEQELRLGLDGVHIEAGPLRVDGYDLVQDIRESDVGIVVTLTPDAARKAEVGQDIEIELESKVIDGFAVADAVQMFRDRLRRAEQS
ncbi:MAG: hypothetical protein P0Y59_21360 [Candidatus Sphingomonas phytovorans]|nr:hypothetical protein [Sphingomonas sp.]WEJ99434.1 MAG: hypothetical protein P0Y59_21360 [Sphingomonas sp.]